MRTAAHPKRTILVATDFSKPGRLVIPYAFKLALALNLRLAILHVVKAPSRIRAVASGGAPLPSLLENQVSFELSQIIRLANENGLMAAAPAEHSSLSGSNGLFCFFDGSASSRRRAGKKAERADAAGPCHRALRLPAV